MIIIADDITGAAELAGIAHSHGLRVQLVCPVVGEASKLCSHGEENAATLGGVAYYGGAAGARLGSVAYYGVLVIATDTRSMTEGEAVEETRRIAYQLTGQSSAFNFQSSVFKKTDSALRGHVIAELKALMAAVGYKRVVYMPANPSKGRIIKDGVYYIKDVRGEGCDVRGERLVPLHETAFSYDPEFPARTSSLRERFPDAATAGIIMPDAETLDDVRDIVARYNDGNTLFAGAADLFREFLLCLAEKVHTPSKPVPFPSPIVPSMEDWGGMGEGLIVLCGSTQSNPQAIGIAESAMPLSVYDGGDDLQSWLDDALRKYKVGGALMLTVPHRHRTGRTTAIHLRRMMATMTRQLFSLLRCSVNGGSTAVLPRHLVIEGGATAWATLQALGWTQLDIIQELAPGVVQMRATDGTIVTLKPGSYPWKR